MLDTSGLPWASRRQPDGRMAVYVFSRGSYVLVSEAEYETLRRLNVRSVFISLIIYVPGVILWIMYFKGQARLQAPIFATVICIALAILLERLMKRSSLDTLMRAPLSNEPVRPFKWRSVVEVGLAAMSDRAVRRWILSLYFFLVARPFLMLMNMLGIGEMPAIRPQDIVIYILLSPVMIAGLLELRREKVRRASKASSPADESLS
jgi:hypothetical protein